MKVLRYDSLRGLDAQLPLDKNITLIHLGRGGVLANGLLDGYNRERVRRTLKAAYIVETIRPSAEIQILWTGGHNRQQDRRGGASYSEARAAYRYALTQTDDLLTMLTEEESTSTVENATRSTELVPDGNVIIVVTDQLHYLAWKVQFIMRLVFPGRKIIFVQLPKSPPGTNWKSRFMHAISTAITVVGMTGVRRGDAAAIQRRQELLQRLTGH